MEGQASDIKIHAERIIKMKEKLNKILAKHTGQTMPVIEKVTDHDNFMTASEVKKYRLVNKVIE